MVAALTSSRYLPVNSSAARRNTEMRSHHGRRDHSCRASNAAVIASRTCCSSARLSLPITRRCSWGTTTGMDRSVSKTLSPMASGIGWVSSESRLISAFSDSASGAPGRYYRPGSFCGAGTRKFPCTGWLTPITGLLQSHELGGSDTHAETVETERCEQGMLGSLGDLAGGQGPGHRPERHAERAVPGGEVEAFVGGHGPDHRQVVRGRRAVTNPLDVDLGGPPGLQVGQSFADDRVQAFAVEFEVTASDVERAGQPDRTT